MSGFAGMVSAGGTPPDPQLLERLAAQLAFRGPDATQIWSQGDAGFCFTLLRTGPAPQASEQPCTLDGRVWLLGDVRLDGRDDLIRQLEQAGETLPPSVTDEELVLRAWRLWGEKSLPDLLGDFAFALWDGEARRLHCVRDLLGARPFFYAKSAGQFHFSNTLEALRQAPGVSSKLDPQFIGDFLLREWCQDGEKTAYLDIRRLPAGHALVYSHEELCVRSFIQFSAEEPLLLSRTEEYVEQFQELLERAVRDRLPNKPCAIFLSGGLDSTSIGAVARKIASKDRARGPLRAYTVDCRPLFNDQEGHLASLVADSLGIQIEILSAGSCPPFEGWEGAVLRTPEPYNDPFLSLTQRLYRCVQGHSGVVLSGYGGDDILTGQAWPYLVCLFRNRNFGTIVKTFGQYLLKQKRIPPLRGGFRSRLRRWIGRGESPAEFPPWLDTDFAEQHNLRWRWQGLQQTPSSGHPWHPIAYSGLSSRFWSNVLECEDAGWTGVPVELRSPLLDRRLLRFLLRVPPVPWCMEKELLREAMRGRLPEVIRARPKTPLPGDLIQQFIESNKWRPLPLPEPPAEVREFVDWNALRATLAAATGSTLWAGLRAVSLSYWLKGVVNKEGIR